MLIWNRKSSVSSKIKPQWKSIYRVQYKERTSVVFGQVRVRANETWSIKWEHVPMYTHNDWQLVSFCVTFLDMCRYISWRWFFFSSRFDGCYFGSLLFFFYPQRTTSNWFDGLIWIHVEDTLIWTRYYGVLEYTMIALIGEKSVVKPCFISEKHQWISTYQIFDSICEHGLYRMRKYTIWFLLLFTLVSIAIKCRKYGLYKWEPEHIRSYTNPHTRTHTSPTLIDSIHNANSVYYCHQHGFTHTNRHTHTHAFHSIFECLYVFTVLRLFLNPKSSHLTPDMFVAFSATFSLYRLQQIHFLESWSLSDLVPCHPKVSNIDQHTKIVHLIPSLPWHRFFDKMFKSKSWTNKNGNAHFLSLRL